MRKANTYKVFSFIPFVFYHEENEIKAQYNAFGFIKIFLNGSNVASKWSLSTNSFILFNIDTDLYSVQLEPDNSDEILCFCTLNKNGHKLQRQKLIFHESDEPAGGVLFSILTVILFSTSALFATGCIYWHVSDAFYDVLYSTTAIMMLLKVIYILKDITLEVVPLRYIIPGESEIYAKPLKAAAIFNQSSIHLGHGNWIFLFFVCFILLIVIGWEINYAGDPVQEYSGTVISRQWVSTGYRLSASFRLAKVEILPNKIVKADCPESKENDLVIVHEKTAIIFRNTIYECAEH